MSSQNGFALAASIMVLALLSVLGAAAIQSTTLEVKISAHDRDARVALYLAESALEEARYYAARGWGKISDHMSGKARVETVTPTPPGFSWAGDRYASFTLVDEDGNRFWVDSHTDGAKPVITYTPYAGSPPAPRDKGRFVIVRNMPTPDVVPDTTVTWAAPNLIITNPDPAWVWDDRAALYPDAWKGWLLWNDDGQSYEVKGSTGSTAVNEVRLELDGSVLNPGPEPYTLAINPWLAALDSGTSVPEDAVPGTPEWDRTFPDIGDAQVTVGRRPTTAATYGDTYEITATGIVEYGGIRRERDVALHVYNAGRDDQRVGDWVVR